MKWRGYFGFDIWKAVICLIFAVGSLHTTQALGEDTQPGAALTRSNLGWQPGYSLNGVNGYVYSLVTDGTNIFAAGRFSTAGSTIAQNIAAWDGSQWQALGSGLPATVTALALDGRGHLYASSAFDLNLGSSSEIYRWDGATWVSLNTNLNGFLFALACDGEGHLIAGGSFDAIGGMAASNIAHWDGSQWQTLGSGLSNDDLTRVSVNTLAFDRFGRLYAGGRFQRAGGLVVNHLARWDGTAWSSLGDGMSSPQPGGPEIWALTFDGRGNLYAGGSFAAAGGVSADNVAMWDGRSWKNLGPGLANTLDSKSGVKFLAADGNTIYAGGTFQRSGDTPLGSIAQWKNSAWESLGDGMTCNTFEPFVSSMVVDLQGDLFTGGRFCFAGGISANNVAKWNDSTWQALGADHSVNGLVSSIVFDPQGRMVVGGNFSAAGGTSANNIAMLDGQTWHNLAGGVTGLQYPYLAAHVSAMAFDPQGNMYVGGDFAKAGSVDASNIAMWDGADWHALGSGLNSEVLAIAIDSRGIVYAAGISFNGGVGENNSIAAWDGNSWTALGGIGPSGFVFSLAIDPQDRIYASGYFSLAGEPYAAMIARWDGLTWLIIPGSDIYGGRQILVSRGDLIAGAGTGLGRWDGIQWNSLGGITGRWGEKVGISALAANQAGDLVVGGNFAAVGGVPADNIARWHNGIWEALGDGIDEGPTILAFSRDNVLFAGGIFSTAGGQASLNLAEWVQPYSLWLPQIER